MWQQVENQRRGQRGDRDTYRRNNHRLSVEDLHARYQVLVQASILLNVAMLLLYSNIPTSVFKLISLLLCPC